MKKFVCLLLVLALCFGIRPGNASAASLWVDGTNLVGDKKPGRVGDIVTVLVRENTKTKDKGKTNVKKTNDNSVSDGKGIFSFLKAFGFNSKSDMTGDGSTERTHVAQTSITCLVTDMLPNGNLIIEGTRDVTTHEENLELKIVGVIRPEDVDANNNILSDRIANAEIGIKGRGALTRIQKPGLLTQILQTIF